MNLLFFDHDCLCSIHLDSSGRTLTLLDSLLRCDSFLFIENRSPAPKLFLSRYIFSFLLTVIGWYFGNLRMNIPRKVRVGRPTVTVSLGLGYQRSVASDQMTEVLGE
jgi:hypothetical protein